METAEPVDTTILEAKKYTKNYYNITNTFKKIIKF